MLGALSGFVRTLDPQRHWLPTSPSGGLDANSLEYCLEHPDRLADVHGPWQHQGPEDHYKLYNAGTSLLSSEFGVGGFTNPLALRRILPEEAKWPVSGRNEYYNHRGAWWINEPQLQKMFGGKIKDLDTLIKVSQYTQFEGLRYALESNIRRIPRNSGTFPWQFNEPYPNCLCTNQIDYYGNPKPAWYAMKNAYRPLYPALSFDTILLNGEASLRTRLWLCGYLTFEDTINRHGIIKWTIFGDSDLISENSILPDGCKPGNELCMIDIDAGGHSVILIRLSMELDGKPPITNEYLFAKDNLGVFLETRPAEVSIFPTATGVKLENTGNTIAYFVFLSAGEDTFFTDNYFCLLPGEERQVFCGQTFSASPPLIRAEGFNCLAKFE
jgi:beta-mannosidase